MRISIIHMKTRECLNEVLSSARQKIYEAALQKPNFIALPEYFSIPGFIDKYMSAEAIYLQTYEPTVNLLREISKKFKDIYIVGGTIIEREGFSYYNTCTIWRNGCRLASYRKRNLIGIEEKIGLSKAESPLVLETEICKVGVLICADIFDQKAVDQTVKHGAEVIFLPVAALHAHPHVEGHPLTERIASEKKVVIVKVGNVRSGAKGGRSAVITPWGVISEADDSYMDAVLTVDLDLEKLRSLR
ncbi:MAG: carbon-nitrogen hydrolase family protein [Candidatus Bathyarchaeia archaeon]